MITAPEARSIERQTDTSVWEIDPAHSSVEFAVRHMMVATVKGQFRRFSGRIAAAGEDLRDARVEAEIDASSVDTGVADCDNHLRSPDFFDVTRYPTLSFRSTRVETEDGEEGTLHGELTLHGVTRPVALKVEYGGEMKDPYGNLRRGFFAETTLDRKDFGITWNKVLDSGGVLAGDKVKVALNIAAVRKAEA